MHAVLECVMHNEPREAGEVGQVPSTGECRPASLASWRACMLRVLSLLLLQPHAAISAARSLRCSTSPRLWRRLKSCGCRGIMRRGGKGDRGASRGVSPSESVRSCRSGLPMVDEKLGT